MRAKASVGRLAERVVVGRDETGRDERVVIWIERRPGAVWAVGRQVNPQHRTTEEPRADDYVWLGSGLDDCLAAANATLADDRVVSEGDGRAVEAEPFRRDDLLRPLGRFFFGRS